MDVSVSIRNLMLAVGRGNDGNLRHCYVATTVFLSFTFELSDIPVCDDLNYLGLWDASLPWSNKRESQPSVSLVSATPLSTAFAKRS
jgi:hypothetical protein